MATQLTRKRCGVAKPPTAFFTNSLRSSNTASSQSLTPSLSITKARMARERERERERERGRERGREGEREGGREGGREGEELRSKCKGSVHCTLAKHIMRVANHRSLCYSGVSILRNIKHG